MTERNDEDERGGVIGVRLMRQVELLAAEEGRAR
jgi:hypothetical protein